MYHKGTVTAITEPSPRPPGRPRSEDADRAILVAALHLLARDGYDRTSIEAVAAEADVTRATVYRRYPTKADLIAAAVSSLAGVEEPQAEGARAYVVETLRCFREGVERSDALSIVSSLYLHRHDNPETLALFRDRVIAPCHRRLLGVLGEARGRGELRPDCDLELALDMLFGSYLHRAFAGLPVAEDWAPRAVAAIWPLIAVE